MQVVAQGLRSHVLQEGAALTQVLPDSQLCPSQKLCSGRRGTIGGQPLGAGDQDCIPTFHKAQPRPPGIALFLTLPGDPPLRPQSPQPQGKWSFLR